MEDKMIFAGFGGQGVLLAGQLIAEAGMKNDKNVTWMPSYGPEMRGGSANCSVVVSDEPIGAPIIVEPDLLVAMNIPSLELFQDRVKSGGYIIYNSSLINQPPTRKDVKIIPLPCNEIANELGVPKVVNMPILGAVVALTNIVSVDILKEVMLEKFGENKKQLIELNMEAIKKGQEVVDKLGVK